MNKNLLMDTSVKISLREAYGNTLVKLGKERAEFITLDADMCGATSVGIFRDAFPERHICFGIAEQNMMSAAAGLSTFGYTPIVNTMAVFASMRAIEQFRTSVAFPNFNVKVVGSHQGIGVGNDGPTHQCIEDISIMRAIPNTVILSPGDDVELEAMMRYMLDYKGPVYLRTGRLPVVRLFDEDYVFKVGCWPVLRDGTDCTVVANSVMIEFALEAAEILKDEGISIKVLNASTLKPVDEEDFIRKVGETGCVVTAEDHNTKGGVGSIVSDILCKHRPLPLEKIGVQDRFGESGDAEELFERFGMTPKDICAKVREVISRK